MRTPRRIFRKGSASVLGRVGLGIASCGVAAMLALGVAGVLRALPLVAGTPDLPRRLLVDAKEIAVVDGDTLLLRGLVVRLAGIVAPSRGAPCPGGADCGTAAAAVLAGLVRDRRLDCHLQGQDDMGRPFAACDANGTDLSSAVVARGWARVEPESAVLSRLELEARKRGAGLWAEAAAH